MRTRMAMSAMLFFIACESEEPSSECTTPLRAAPDRVTLSGTGVSRSISFNTEIESSTIDASVARFERGRLRAVAPGATTLEVANGECSLEIPVEVLDVGSAFGSNVLSVSISAGGGFGSSNLPDVVLGPPKGGGEHAGSTDVLSLGHGGSIELSFDPLWIYDGPGPDFVVFENAFRIFGVVETYAEPGEVSVSKGGAAWTAFPCDAHDAPYVGCAGVTPTMAGALDPELDPTDVDHAGGDAFDLETVAPFIDRIRITDVSSSTLSDGQTAGFDLDSVAAMHVVPSDVESILASETSISLGVNEEKFLPRIDALCASSKTVFGLRARVFALDENVAVVANEKVIAKNPGVTDLLFQIGSFETTVRVEVLP